MQSVPPPCTSGTPATIKASLGLGRTHTTEAKEDACTVPGWFCQVLFVLLHFEH